MDGVCVKCPLVWDSGPGAGGAMHVSETASPCGEGEAERGEGKESSRTPLSQDSQVDQF